MNQESRKTEKESLRRDPGFKAEGSLFSAFLPSCFPNSYLMIASKDTLEPKSSDYVMPNSQRVYVEGEIHPEVRVPFREISLAPTKDFNGQLEPNEPVRVYDTSGPWGDPQFAADSSKGIPALREKWIRGRGDVAEYEGREIKPEDNGYLTRGHEEFASQAERKNRLDHFQGAKRKPLRACAGHPVTQLWYARQGIITPEMEFIAIRENHRIASQKEEGRRKNGESELLNSSFLLHPSERNSLPHPTPAKASAPRSRKKSPPNSSAPKSPAAAPSSRPTSTIPSSSR